MVRVLPCHLLLLSLEVTVTVTVTHGRQDEAQGNSNVALSKGIGAVPSLREREKRDKMKTSSPAAGGTGSDWCDMSVKCRCRWRWANIGLCSKCHDKLQHRGCGLSSTFLFFLSSVLLFSSLGMLFAWLSFSPYKQLNNTGALGCQPDNEGSWSIGVYKGSSPFALQPIEMVSFNKTPLSFVPPFVCFY